MGVENKVKVTQDLQCTGNDSPGRYKVLLKKGKIKLIMHLFNCFYLLIIIKIKLIKIINKFNS